MSLCSPYIELVKGYNKQTGLSQTDRVITNGQGYHKRTGSTETVLVISISVCTNSTL